MPSEIKDTYYVGIGASAGGLESLEQFFTAIPSDTGMVFIVVQHLSPDFKSMMDELLERHTQMPIDVIKDGMITEPNHIYLIPPRTNLSIYHGKLFLEEQAMREQIPLPIDSFFKSLATDQEENAVGIILSGTGSDGTVGLKAIKEKSGLVIAEDQKSAKFDGMPRSAISTGLVDYILAAKDMAEELVHYIKHPVVHEQDTQEPSEKSQDELTRASMIMRNHCGIDFSSYKETTMIRRINRRIKVNRLHSFKEYVSYLAESEEERNILRRELFIGVTGFFRDEDAFAKLEEKVLPQIDFEKDTIRVWSAGCSTGEEVYSLAIMLQEHMHQINSKAEVKIFATDVDEYALEMAGTGYYPDSLLANVEPKLITRYFIKKTDGFQVKESIRKMIVFAKHNILKDPPFSRLDMLVCRNLFIYLKSEKQHQVLEKFYHSLHPNGFLFLGSSESIGDLSVAYKVVDSKWKIYQYKPGYRPATISNVTYSDRRAQRVDQNDDQNQMIRIEKVLQQGLESISPPSIVIDSKEQIIHVVNDVSSFIKTQPGRFSNNFNSNMSKELALFIHNLMRRLKSDRTSSIVQPIGFLGDNQKHLTLKGYLLEIQKTDFFFISFIEADKEENESLVEVDMSDEVNERVQHLEQQLQQAREGLQATVEELETSNEELQSSNEELIASNEELQSTNQELQSVNEELYTVNKEHQAKIDQLTESNNDLNNLIRNTEIGALYLDNKLQIRRITPIMTSLTNIRESDIGRPISHLTVMDQYPSLTDDIYKVLDTLESMEKEIYSSDGSYWFSKIRPYRTEYNSVDGIIVTLMEITNLKNEQSKVNRGEKRLSTLMDQGKLAWWEFNVPENHFVHAPKRSEMLGYKNSDFPKCLEELLEIVHEDDKEKVANEIELVQTGKKESFNISYRMLHNDQSYVWFHDQGEVVEKDDQNYPVKLAGIVTMLHSNK
ncbi:CheR family methyltransferase [Saliterribacillus persicus]|uniref:protein-glutamate O-methyltransferase n=1 Tax=Saliterribacillus persicus TaxID=930114 RepID=A0A368XTJ1_9BACI|nr:CheR family methyltransferase [Saliterribacillus persicus]RCW69837.1 two-component system CheB/CheR fusion protein [Saliterribacillus persicus]